jgi:MBG domain (YGX type)
VSSGLVNGGTFSGSLLRVGADAVGGANPTLTYVSSGLVNGDALSELLAASGTVTSNIGTYGISQGTLAALSNFALSYMGANLTATVAPLSVTAKARSRIYGAANPTLRHVSTSRVNDYTLTGAFGRWLSLHALPPVILRLSILMLLLAAASNVGINLWRRPNTVKGLLIAIRRRRAELVDSRDTNVIQLRLKDIIS